MAAPHHALAIQAVTLPSGIVTFLTDFGTRDPFVGVMKGVVLGRFAAARLVDLSHAVPAQDVAFGAFWLERSMHWFAPGTVHVAVVDPGVGSARRAIAARADGQLLVGPDNGLLAAALERAGEREVRLIDAARLGLPAPSRTFHGRDVFAPVAAELASGRWQLTDLGDPITDFVASPVPAARSVAGGFGGEVVVVDGFGNLITNLEASLLADFADPRIHVAGRELALAATYADVPRGELVALVDAFEVIEIACRDGSAAEALGVGRGAPVRLWSAEGDAGARRAPR
jgi:hypothetical protein